MVVPSLQGVNVTETIQKRIDRIRACASVDVRELHEVVGSILALAGFSAAASTRAAQILVAAQRFGIDSHGIAHLPVYLRRVRCGGIVVDAVPDLKLTGSAAGVLDGKNALGVLVADQAIEAAGRLARNNGIGVVAVRNSNHFGAVSVLVSEAAERGLIALAFSNAAPTMAAWGGKNALLGTNPIAAAFPRGSSQPPIVIDMATSAVARGRIRKAQRAGEALPLDWALDAEGNPTADATAALSGTMQPMGGAKGFALSLMIELLSTTLSGGRAGFDVLNPHDRPAEAAGTSHLFIVIDPSKFSGLAGAEGAADRVARRIEQSEVVDEQKPPRVPGSRSFAEAHQRDKTGIPMSKALCDHLQDALALLRAAHAA